MTDPNNPFGAPPPPPYGQPTQNPYGQPQQGAYNPAFAHAPQDGGRRPGTVTAAAVLTWVGSTIALLSLGFLLVAVLAGVDEYYEGFEESASGWTRDQISTFTVIFAGIGIVWALVAIVLAFFVMRGAAWARIVLTISAAVAIPLCLLTALAILPVLNLIMCIAAIVLLYVGRGNAWFRAGGQRR
ncbi:hypothetical protein [Nocardioides lijunqiniae]|uniref:hypothetical protein n=1 Tax=Nocardioides lijunqiniae TaxID=2760832 RepID=UPI00187848BF|nr:hypothetical protein [Nocardioides lijunqiniae]